MESKAGFFDRGSPVPSERASVRTHVPKSFGNKVPSHFSRWNTVNLFYCFFLWQNDMQLFQISQHLFVQRFY